MKARENHLPLPMVGYDKAVELVQKECDEAYNKVIPFNHLIWDTFKYNSPLSLFQCNLNPD